MRAEAGAVTTKSAPGAGSTKPVTCAALRMCARGRGFDRDRYDRRGLDFLRAAAAAAGQGRESKRDEDEAAGGDRH